MLFRALRVSKPRHPTTVEGLVSCYIYRYVLYKTEYRDERLHLFVSEAAMRALAYGAFLYIQNNSVPLGCTSRVYIWGVPLGCTSRAVDRKSSDEMRQSAEERC